MPHDVRPISLSEDQGLVGTGRDGGGDVVSLGMARRRRADRTERNRNRVPPVENIRRESLLRVMIHGADGFKHWSIQQDGANVGQARWDGSRYHVKTFPLGDAEREKHIAMAVNAFLQKQRPEGFSEDLPTYEIELGRKVEEKRDAEPRALWDNKDRKWKVSLPMKEGTMDASWVQSTVTVIRLREIDGSWSPGFVTPLNNVEFTDLRPSTEYEMELRHMNEHGKGKPIYRRFITDPNASASPSDEGKGGESC